MASWKKVIVSGSNAELNQITSSGGFSGDGSGLTGVVGASVANNLTVDNSTIQLNSGTTYNGSAARTISVKNSGIDTNQLADDAVTNAKLANIARGSVKVGGASNAPTDLDAKTSGQILIGDGTDINSVAISGDIALSGDGAVTIQANVVEGSMLNSNVAGSGLDYGSNELSVDVSDFMTNGSNNRIVTATGTDAMNAEANLTFDGSELALTGTMTSSGIITANGDSGVGFKVNGGGTLYSVAGVVGNEISFAFENNTPISIGRSQNPINLKGQVTASIISASSTITANSFVGDGSDLSGITADSLANNLTVDNATLQLNSGTTFNGSAARTISVKDGGIDADALASAVAGNGLTGGGGSALAVGAGTGIDVAANEISVDVSDFMSNGSNNRLITATGTDTMTAEANLTFDGSTLTVTGDASISGDLTVAGDLTSLQVTNLNIEDKFILLNSGSTSGDGGIIVQTGTNGIGTSFFYDDSLKRWGLTIEDGTAWNATSDTADYFVNAVSSSAGAPTGNPYGFGNDAASRRGLMVVDTNTEDIYIYS